MKNISLLSWGKIVVIVFAVMVAVIAFFLKPNVNYEGALNGTNLIYGEYPCS
jgi:hypothetical protein